MQSIQREGSEHKPPDSEFKEGEPFNPYGKFFGARVPNAILQHRGLTDQEKLTYGVLCDIGGDNGDIYGSYDYIAKRRGCSRDTVRRHCYKLKRLKLISIGVHEAGKTNWFRFLYRESVYENPEREANQCSPAHLKGSNQCSDAHPTSADTHTQRV